MAFIVWRVAQQMLKRMRGAQFDIDAGRPYFDFMREVLVFLIAISDRIAHDRLSAADRQAFTPALVHHVARTLQDNEDALLGPATGAATHADTFVELVNEVVGHYAEFGADPAPPADAQGFHPDFVRALPGHAARTHAARKGPPLGAGPGHGHRGPRGGGRGATLHARAVRPHATARTPRNDFR
jgi:hypothetical protein